MVSYTVTEAQIVFKMLLALIANQLTIIGQLGKRSIYGELDCFLEVVDNVLERDDLADKATRDVFSCSIRLQYCQQRKPYLDFGNET